MLPINNAVNGIAILTLVAIVGMLGFGVGGGRVSITLIVGSCVIAVLLLRIFGEHFGFLFDKRFIIPLWWISNIVLAIIVCAPILEHMFVGEVFTSHIGLQIYGVFGLMVASSFICHTLYVAHLSDETTTK